jgi:hypothetical protein
MTPYWSFINTETGEEIVRELTEEEYAQLVASHIDGVIQP